MDSALIDQAVELLEKANSDLEPELLSGESAHGLLEAYARAEKPAAFGVAALARRLDDASHIARMMGVSAGKAKAVVATGKTMSESDDLSTVMQHGRISLDQAAEIAAAEESAPGAAVELVAVAQKEAFHVLKDKARKAKLETEQHRNLSRRQRAAAAPGATATSSAWSTSISRSSPTSERRSWRGPRPRRGSRARPKANSDKRRSSATSRTRTRCCCRARAGLGVPSS
jgi:hypothetical protein